MSSKDKDRLEQGLIDFFSVVLTWVVIIAVIGMVF